MYPDNVVILIENFRQMDELVQKLLRLKMGQILCVKKVPFCKSGYIFSS